MNVWFKSIIIALSMLLLPLRSLCSDGAVNIPDAIERVRGLTLQGLEYAYNLDFSSANSKFDEAIAVEPTHPRPHLAKASLLFWRYLVSKSDDDYESFLILADKAIETAENFLEKHGNDADALTCLGTLYAERAFARGRAKSYLKAAWDGKKSYDYYIDALEENPTAFDAYLGVGLYHYFVSFLPKPLQWMTSNLGIEGNPERGIREIRLAAEKGIYAKVEAQYSLSQFLPWYANDFDSGEKILQELSQRYPANSLFSFTLAVWEIRRHDIESARQRLLVVVKSEQSKVIGLKALGLYKLAECHYRLGKFAEANVFYQEFLQEYRDENYVATANYRIGICYEMMGGREKALPYYRAATVSAKRHGDDAYSARKAEERLAAPLSMIDSVMLKAQNFLKTGHYVQARELFSLLTTAATISVDQQMEAKYGLGEAYYEQASYLEALKFFDEVSQTNVSQKELWLRPWSEYYAAMCYLKLGNFQSAKARFKKVNKYSDYDFENWLTFRTERELERLEKTN